jgi:transposase InsO family protein
MSANPKEMAARERLEVLELGWELGNISEACRRAGISRYTFYEWKRRYQEAGLEGLTPRAPIHKSHPFATAPEVVARVRELSLQDPARGCNWISEQLKLEGISLSHPTVQNILGRLGMRRRHDRWLRLEQEIVDSGLNLNERQLEFLEKQNPCWKERFAGSSRPGELVCQDILAFRVDPSWPRSEVYLYAAVDCYSGYAFGFAHTQLDLRISRGILRDLVLAFFSQRGVPVTAVLTSSSPLLSGLKDHPYEAFLLDRNIEHRRSEGEGPPAHGFMERFRTDIKEKSFQVALRQVEYSRSDTRDDAIDEWFQYYNGERPYYGYPNYGRTPTEAIRSYLKASQEDR